MREREYKRSSLLASTASLPETALFLSYPSMHQRGNTPPADRPAYAEDTKSYAYSQFHQQHVGLAVGYL